MELKPEAFHSCLWGLSLSFTPTICPSSFLKKSFKWAEVEMRTVSVCLQNSLWHEALERLFKSLKLMSQLWLSNRTSAVFWKQPCKTFFMKVKLTKGIEYLHCSEPSVLLHIARRCSF